MAEDADRAERIRQIKDENPGTTWAQIAERVGVTERSAIAWQRTGAISYDNAKKLAAAVGVELDWLWAGPRGGTPNLMGRMSPNGSDVHAKLDALDAKLDRVLLLLSDEFDDEDAVQTAEEVAQKHGQKQSAAGGNRRRTRRSAGPS